MARWWGIMVGVILAAGLLSLLDSTPPEGFSAPWTFKLVVAISRIMTAMANLACRFGFGESDILLLNSIQRPIPVPTEYMFIQSQDVDFDGVPVRIYRKPHMDSKPTPALVYFHGGGFAIMSVDFYDGITRRLANSTETIVISVEYRLAPKHPYPAALDDSVKAYKYLVQNADAFGVDPSRIGVAGDSAGGNLAATVSLRLRNNNFQPLPRYQILVYPSTQTLDLKTPSYQQNGQGGFYGIGMSAKFKSMYLLGEPTKYVDDFASNNHAIPSVRAKYGKTFLKHENILKSYPVTDYVKPQWGPGNTVLWERIKGAVLSPYMSPLLADDLSGLPPAHIITCEADMLRDDGIWYYQRLKDDGNDASHKHFKSGFHGVLNFWLLFSEGKDILQDMEQYIVKHK